MLSKYKLKIYYNYINYLPEVFINMPHLILHQSSNLSNQESNTFFSHAHQILTTMLPTKIDNCKSGLFITDNYFIADGKADIAFAHLEVAVLPGREHDLLTAISKELFTLLHQHLTTGSNSANNQLNLQISVEMRTLSNYYHKS